jgi:nucleotide-binding universal stress UspA family protein
MSNSSAFYQGIVVGTDGSERAHRAVREAIALAKLTGAKVHVVQAVHSGAAAGFANDYQGQLVVDQMVEEAKANAKKVADEAEQAGVAAEIHTPSGPPADAILSVAESTGADLIVVGNRGMTGAKRFVLGSVPNSISHRSPCSVLIVSTDRDERE